MGASDYIDRVRSAGGDDEPGLSTAVLAGAVAALVSLPIVALLYQAWTYGLGHLVDLLTASRSVDVVVNSVVLIAVVTAGCVIIGVPLAVFTVQTDLPGRRLWTIVAALPLVVPSYIGAITFAFAFGPNGSFSDLFSVVGVDSIPSIYGLPGTALVLILFTYPYVFLTTRASLLSFDGTLAEAARTLNHSRWEAFRRVTVPQILPGVTAGALLAALYALADFGVPTIMRYRVFTQQIYVAQTSLGVADGYPALLSIQLLGVVAVVLALESWIGDGETTITGNADASTIRLGVWKWPVLGACLALAALTLGVPLAMLATWFVQGGTDVFAFDPEVAWNSVTVSVAAALVAAVLALPVAWYGARSSSITSTVADRLTYVGYAVPGVVIGISLLYLSTGFAQSLYKTVPLVVFAYVVRFLPQAVGSTRSSLLQVDPTLLEAARSLGRSPASAFRHVTLPLIAPGIAAGAALVFLTSMKELPATLLLRPIGFETLVSHIWLVRSAGSYGAAAIPTLVLIGVSGLSLVVILAQERFSK